MLINICPLCECFDKDKMKCKKYRNNTCGNNIIYMNDCKKFEIEFSHLKVK